MSETRSFEDFGVDAAICAALREAGITSPFPIQELTLPLALSGADVIGQARTGTGKTLAFGIPLLQKVDAAGTATQGLVVVPTRELCIQVRADLDQSGAHKGVPVVAVYGGRPLEPQIAELQQGAPIVVGTPGRLLDLSRRGALDLSSVTQLVLDEADEMLDLGFLPDVEQLIQSCADQRQTQLFSATMPSAVVSLARRYMHKPTFLRADVEEVRIAPETEQYFFSCHRMDKPAVLARILQTPERGLCVVFTRTKRMADVLASELRDRDIPAAPIHSDLRQEARERAMSRFREGTVDVLVATEVAARGLDITDVTHVVNYDCPDDEKMYLHRIGRTGRAGAAGTAITLAVWNELARLEMIKKALDVDAPTHEVFSTSPILDELFDLPPRGARPAAPATETRQQTGDGDGQRTRQPARRDRPRRETAPPTPAPTPDQPAEEPRRRTRRRGTTEETGGERSGRARTRTRKSATPAPPEPVEEKPARRRPKTSKKTPASPRSGRAPRPAGDPTPSRGTGRPALNRPMDIVHLP